MFSEAVLQVTSFVSALLLAYFTGAWRRYGRRMERLFELAEKLPKGSEVRRKFEAAALVEAERAAQKLDLPPRSVRIAVQVLLSWLLLILLSNVIVYLEKRGLVSQYFEDLGYSLGYSTGELSRQFPDTPWQFFLVTTLASLAFLMAAIISLMVLLNWVWIETRHLHSARVQARIWTIRLAGLARRRWGRRSRMAAVRRPPTPGVKPEAGGPGAAGQGEGPAALERPEA